MKYFALVIVAYSCLICHCEKVRYDNYRSYQVEVNDDKGLEVFQELEEFSDAIIFLTEPSIHQPFYILVAPHQLAHISELFERLAIKNEVQHENYQQVIDAEQPTNVSYSGFGWNRYHDLRGINAWLDQMVQRYPSILTSQNYGTSVEGRPLRAIKLSKNIGAPTIFIESTIHAREWVTAASTTYILNELLTSSDPEMQKIANSYTWVIVPVVNVDGYEYSHTTNRMWRKNRRVQGNCVGTDLNRNFDHHHGETGASMNPCAESYAGPSPFSEPETLALSRFIKSTGNVKLYISFHSYSQLLLFPYGHTYAHAPNHDQMNKIAQATTAAISRRYGTRYRYGSIANAIYIASGSSIDWAYEKSGIRLAYTFEFRDTGANGFILPPDQIIPNSLEIIDGLKVMVREALS